jgi:hypothetical protein
VTLLKTLATVLTVVLLPASLLSAAHLSAPRHAAPYPTPSHEPDGCSVVGNPDPQLAARAMAACVSARHRLEDLFGEPAATVKLHLVPELRLPSFWVAKDSVAAYVPTLPGGADSLGSFQQWERSAPHEIAHALYNARTGILHPYGPGDGDWFVEAVAIWAESDASRQNRIHQAAGPYRHVVELPRVLSMHHPMQDSRGVSLERVTTSICRGICPDRPDTLYIREMTRADGTRTVDTLSADSPILVQSEVATAFYATALAVLQFVHERGGPAAVRLIEERLRAGAGADALVNVPGLPPAFEDFSREWEEWLAHAARREPAAASESEPKSAGQIGAKSAPAASINASGSQLSATQQ